MSKSSEERLTKATELLQKVWWFTFFLVISPFAVGFTIYAISSIKALGVPLLVSLSISVIAFTFAFLFFYKAFDKYRDRPFFLNKENNLEARIHVIYVITILSLVVTPVFTMISTLIHEKLSFSFLPLISFAVLYNIIYYYYSHKPIDFYNKAEGEFKHAISVELIIKQPYNIIILFNYVVHFIFLFFTFPTDLSWTFALITNISLYILTFTNARKTSNKIKESIKTNKPFLEDLTRFKQKFLISITSLTFILLIQMPFVLMIFPGKIDNSLFAWFKANGIFLSVIFLLVYFKAIFYIYFHYSSIFKTYKDSTDNFQSNEEVSTQGIKYQKYNTIISEILIGLLTVFGFLTNSHLIILPILFLLLFFFYSEQKAKICPVKYNKYVLLSNSAAILISISFGLFSSVFLLNIQFVIFLISLYFILQVFAKIDYFAKESILVFQNILAVASFTIITYSFFEYTTFEGLVIFRFLEILDPLVIKLSNFFIHALLISFTSLISFYILYSRFFYPSRSKLFRRVVYANIFFIELVIFFLINLITSFSAYILILSSLLFPTIYLLLIFTNYLLGIFSQRDFVVTSYYLFWILIGDIFLSIFILNLSNFIILSIDFLFLSIFCHLNFKFGLGLEKVKESTVNQFTKINSYSMVLELFAIFFFFFYSIVLPDIILSVYFSLVIMTILVNLLSRKEILFSSSVIIKINVITLVVSAVIACYYSVLSTLGTTFVFLYPFLSLFSILILPSFYMLRKKIYEKFNYRAIILNCALLVLFITLTPIISILEASPLLGDITLAIYYTMLIFPSISLLFVFGNYLLGILSQKRSLMVSHYLLWILIIDVFLVVLFTSLSLNNYIIVTLDSLFLSFFSQLNLRFGLKLNRVKESSVKRFTRSNSYIMTIELSALFFSLFYFIILISLELYLNIVFSMYFSMLVMTFLVNLLSKKERVFSSSISIKINVITLIFSAGLAFYYSFLYTFNTFYVLLIPFLSLFSILFFPLHYLLRKKIYEPILRKFLLLDCISLGIFLTLIPTIVSLDLSLFGLLFNNISILNYSFYILFGVLTFTLFVLKHYKMKDIYQTEIAKTQIFIIVFLIGTTVFYYLFALIPGVFIKFLFPLIAASCFFYLPSMISYKNKYFTENLVKKVILGNSILLSGLLSLIPVFVGLEFTLLGRFVDWIFISILSLFLVFGILKFLYYISDRLKLMEKRKSILNLVQSLLWLSISIFIAFEVGFYFLSDIAISSAIIIFFLLNIYTLKLLLNYSKELKVFNYLKEVLFYGITFSSSFLIISLIQYIPGLNFSFLNILWYIGLFFLINLLLIIYVGLEVKIRFTKLKEGIEFISWIIVQISICLFASLVLVQYNLILTSILLFCLIYTFLMPVTHTFFRKLIIFSEENQLLIKKLVLGIFIISILGLYVDLFFNLYDMMVVNTNLFPPFIILPVVLFLLLYFSLSKFNMIIESDSNAQIYRFYILSFILLASLLFMNFPIPFSLLFLLTLFIILSQRSDVVIFRFPAYILLSYLLFIIITTFTGGFSDFIILYLPSLCVVLLLSIWLNIKKNNFLEKISLYSMISLLSFTYLSVFSEILIIYNITISLFIFLSMMGIYFYRLGNELYKWFIKPCILLLIFDLISFLSYSILFNNPTYSNFNPILTFTLTMSLTGLGFIFLYNKASANFRKKSFYFILISLIMCFPTFLYFLLISSFPILIGSPIPLIAAINVGIFLFYASIGIYQWRISWAIWKTGWYAWITLPLVNFILIYSGVKGIDIVTNALNLFGTVSIEGSFVLSLIICVIWSLPFWYTWLKKNFYHTLFIVWGLNLFLIYWVSQNMFSTSLLLTNLSFVLFALFLIVPLLIKLKFWKITSIFWIFQIVVFSSFLYFYFDSINLSIGIAISFDILLIGLLLVIYSFFPNIRSIGTILILGYFTVLSGIFLSIYFILFTIIEHPIFSINISLIVLGFSFLSSKYVELPTRIIDQTLSWILIINFSWLTFNTFSLYPPMVIFAFFFAMTVFGGSFFIFNRYKLKFRINKIIPYFIISIGASSSISSLFSIFLSVSPNILITIFSSFLIIILYFFFIEYRFVLWFLIPIPITLPILDGLMLFNFVRINSVLTLLVIYLITFQILINIFKNIEKNVPKEIPLPKEIQKMKEIPMLKEIPEEIPKMIQKEILIEIPKEIELRNSIFRLFSSKNQFKMLNFLTLLLNSTFISLFFSILAPFLLAQDISYQVLDFLIIWPIFILFCLKYILKSEINLKVIDPLLICNKISFVLYLIIPIALTSNLFFLMSLLKVDIIIVIYSVLLTISGVIWFESYFIDRKFLGLLSNSTREKFTIGSWFAFCNILSFYIFHFIPLNVFLLGFILSILNQISLYFLSSLNISKQKIINVRVVLTYAILVSGSFYLGSIISEVILIFWEGMGSFLYMTLLFQNSFLILFILSYFFAKVEMKLKSSIELILFGLFQGILAVNWIIIFNMFNVLNFFSIVLILLIETCLMVKTVKYLNFLFLEEKQPNFVARVFALITLCLYFESSLLIYGYLFEFTGIGFTGSVLVSQLFFFTLTILDIYSFKKIKRKYAQLIHTLSYFLISLMTLIVLNDLVVAYPILLSLEISLFSL
ncbi:hypothetical protein LCGC14_0684080, partial [marine sediment metagenome]